MKYTIAISYILLASMGSVSRAQEAATGTLPLDSTDNGLNIPQRFNITPPKPELTGMSSMSPAIPTLKEPPGMRDNFDSYLRERTMELRLPRKTSLWEAGNISLTGHSAASLQPFLLYTRTASLNMNYTTGRLSFRAGITANQYETRTLTNQFGFGGSMNYMISDELSVTLFGSVYNNNPYLSMAAYPYVSTSSYGGYMTYESGKAGIKLGAQRYYDPFSRTWRTDPIVTPIFHVGKVKIELPVGPLVKEGLEYLIRKNRNNSPNIMP